MTRLGDAAVAMWWNVDEVDRTEFHEWHSKEHLPERLSIPGFRRGTRWQDGDRGAFFVLYELADHDVLTSKGYLSRLNDPTPWSTKMMPLHRGMVRSQCRVQAASGHGLSRTMHTVRLSARPGHEAMLDQHLRALVARAPAVSGLTGASLLHTETPVSELTAEQKIRGGDAAADWILLVTGHDPHAWPLLVGNAIGESLMAAGAREDIDVGRFDLVHGVTALDMLYAKEEPA